MLCTLKWGIYIFFGLWQFIAILFVLFLVPETRGVPIEEVSFLCSPLPSRLTWPSPAAVSMCADAEYDLG